MNTIYHNENDNRGIFYIKQEDKTVAELTYTHKEGVMIIDHTEVNPAIEGQGTGTKLVERAVQHALDNDLKVDPLCPFAEVVFDRNANWKNLRV